MKKILPKILIFLILVNLFAPFTLELNKNRTPEIKKSIAEAGDISIKPKQEAGATNTSIPISFHVTRFTKTGNHGMVFVVSDKKGTTIRGNTNDPNYDWRKAIDIAYHSGSAKTLFDLAPGATALKDEVIDFADQDGMDQVFSITLDSLTIGTTYYVSYAGYNGTKDDAYTPPELDFEISTTANAGEVSTVATEGDGTQGGGFLPWCAKAVFSISISGCISQILYNLLFVPTSYIFGLAGQFFDYTFFYSINDSSYRTPFVLEGWGLVRDFVNIFFIFVLLYIAFATILSIHGFKTKEMIINVVIIGLLINFSLFATQVIVDTSNIVARIFYNSEAIKLKDKKGVVVVSEPGKPIGLSEAIVSKVDPQKLIIDASRVGQIKDKGGQGGSASNAKGISNATFILVTLLSTAVNVVGFIVFLMVGLIFVARVIGLWLAMIFVPLTFFSYTVPAMQSIDMFGWKKWWPQTLKLAFLAPIFIFFMYLILKFLNVPSIIGDADTKTGAEFIIAIIVPFAFIIILLNTAKKLATKFAGDIGGAVTKAAVVGGGIAVGGAALSAAFAGRQTIGAVAKYTQNDGKRKNILSFKDTREDWQKAKTSGNPLYALRAIGKGARNLPRWLAAGTAQGATMIGRKTTTRVNPVTGENEKVVTKKGWAQRTDASVEEKAHAEHDLNDAAVAVTKNKDAKYKDLTEPEQKAVRDKIDKGIISKEFYNKPYEKLSREERDEMDLYHRVEGDANGEWSHSAATAQREAEHRGEHVQTAGDMAKALKANVAMGEFIQSLRKGSMDIRDLSKIKKSGYATAAGIGLMAFGGFPLLGAALAASASGGIKSGLKSALSGIDHGSSQKDFFKDLNHTLSTALKSVKIDVKTDSGGHTEAKASTSGGGHH